MLGFIWFFIAAVFSAIISDASKESTPSPTQSKLNVKDAGWIGLTAVLGLILVIILCIIVYIVVLLFIDRKPNVVAVEEE